MKTPRSRRKLLSLTLTSRDKTSPNPVPMAGFPYHALDGYLQKLIRAGMRAAICDQVEDPKTAKGSSNAKSRGRHAGHAHRRCAARSARKQLSRGLWPEQKAASASAWLELSTGRFVVTNRVCEAGQLSRTNSGRRCSSRRVSRRTRPHPARRMPAARIDACEFARAFRRHLPHRAARLVLSPPMTCRRLLLEHFGTQTLEGFDLDADSPGIIAAGALLEYVRETQKVDARPHHASWSRIAAARACSSTKPPAAAWN